MSSFAKAFAEKPPYKSNAGARGARFSGGACRIRPFRQQKLCAYQFCDGNNGNGAVFDALRDEKAAGKGMDTPCGDGGYRRSRARRLCSASAFQACFGNHNNYRHDLRSGSGIPYRCGGGACFKPVFRSGTVDPVADVCVGAYRFYCGAARKSKSA